MDNGKLYLSDWLNETYPEIFKQWQSVRDIAEGDYMNDLHMHYQAHLQKMQMLEEVQKQRNQHLAKLIKEHTK